MSNETFKEMQPDEVGLGLAIYNTETGQCIGVIGPDGSVGQEDADSLLLEAVALNELGEVFDNHHPGRRIARRGPVIGVLGDADINEWLMMADGSRFFYAGASGDEFRLKSRQLVLLPGSLLFEAQTQ